MLLFQTTELSYVNCALNFETSLFSYSLLPQRLLKIMNRKVIIWNILDNCYEEFNAYKNSINTILSKQLHVTPRQFSYRSSSKERNKETTHENGRLCN